MLSPGTRVWRRELGSALIKHETESFLEWINQQLISSWVWLVFVFIQMGLMEEDYP